MSVLYQNKLRVVFIFFLALWSCTKIDESKIQGNWIVVSTDDDFYLGQRFVFYENGRFDQPDDEFDDAHSYGRWQFEGRVLELFNDRYDTSLKYEVQKLNDKILQISDEDGILRLEKLAFERPWNDTIYIEDQEYNESGIFEIINADTNTPFESLNDSINYFFWVLADPLTNYDLDHYNFTVTCNNGRVRGTAVRRQYELFVNREVIPDSLEITISLTYQMDSILLSKKIKGVDSIWTHPKINKYRFYINPVQPE